MKPKLKDFLWMAVGAVVPLLFMLVVLRFHDEPATASWTRFSEVKRQILALSRENTNVRSLTISLNRKRRVMITCQEALGALQKAIEQEPIAGLNYDIVRPR